MHWSHGLLFVHIKCGLQKMFSLNLFFFTIYKSS